MTNDNILVALQAIGNRHSNLELSLRHIAKLLGVSPPYLTRIAIGERPPAKELADHAVWMDVLVNVLTTSAHGMRLADLSMAPRMGSTSTVAAREPAN